jgi:chemotaxis-related protein WspB
MDFHGRSVPVIDLCRASGLPAAADHFDTRIIVVNYRPPEAPQDSSHLLGLRAERVLGVRDVDETRLAGSGVQAAPFLGQVASDAGGMLQLVELEQLLPAPLRALLFQT